MKRQPKAITLPDAERKQAVSALQAYFADHMEEQIGELKAGLLLDFVLSELGPSVYNQALADARAFFEERSNDLGAIFYRDEFPSSRKP